MLLYNNQKMSMTAPSIEEIVLFSTMLKTQLQLHLTHTDDATVVYSFSAGEYWSGQTLRGNNSLLQATGRVPIETKLAPRASGEDENSGPTGDPRVPATAEQRREAQLLLGPEEQNAEQL